MEGFAQDYFILVFIASFGALQIVASYSHLRGILFIKSAPLTRLVGLAMIIAAFAWFFASEPRNIGDNEGGLDANTQALLFALGSLASLVVTLIGSSLVNARMKGNSPSLGEGMEALKETNFIHALYDSLRHHWKIWQTQMHRFFSG